MSALQHTPAPWMRTDTADYSVIYGTRDGRVVAQVALVKKPEDATLVEAAPLLLAACQALHRATDLLMAHLITLDPQFMPTKSEAWDAVVAGFEAIQRAIGEPS